MSTMRAIAILGAGGPEVLSLVERPRPEPGPLEARIRVRATAVNRADLLQRLGVYPAPPGVPADIPGLEYAGEIDALGSSLADNGTFAVGDRVFGLVAGGSYAEALTTAVTTLTKMPAGMSFEDAAAIPEAFITAYDAMVIQGGLRAGDTLLVHAVGSGVGTAAAQLGRALGVTVIGTARTADKLERARPLGLDHGITVGADARFASEVRKYAKDGVSVILDLVGGAYVEEGLRCLRTKGTIVVVGLSAGAKSALDLGLLLQRRARIIGTVLRVRPLVEKVETARMFANDIVPLFGSGALAPVIECVLPLAEAARAHELVGSNKTFGKVVLRV